MDKAFLEALRQSGVFQVKKLLRHGGSYEFIIPRAVAELVGTKVEGDYWVSYELTQEGNLVISPLATDLEQFREYIGES